MNNIIQSGYVGDEDYFTIKCDQCGEDFTTTNDKQCFCCKRCYQEAKAEFNGDI